MTKEKIILVMPAYNAALTLRKTIQDLPQDVVDEIILIDDASQDNTVEIARELGLTVIVHPKNLGYGGNQKTCYRLALEKEADYIIMVHPDYQYDSRLVKVAVDVLRAGVADVILGNRIRTRKEALAGGMPLYKYFFNRCLTILANIWLAQNLGEFHSGFRAYRRKVLETIPFEANSNDFVFDAQFLAQAVYFGFIIGDIPMPVRYFKEASSINKWRSTVYGTQFIGVLLTYLFTKLSIIQPSIFQSKVLEGKS